MNGHANIEATEHLKSILNVGQNEGESENNSKLKNIQNGSMGIPGAGDASNLLPAPSYQQIDFSGSDENSHITILGTNIDIYSSPLEYGAPSSQVLVEDMVDYGWVEKYYNGRLVTLHVTGDFLAYVLKPTSGNSGFVRIVQTRKDLRYLIKEYKGEVRDVSFAHTTSRVLLGSVDASGEMLVHQLDHDNTSINCELLLHILRDEDWPLSEHNRIIWCLYIPEEGDTAEEEAGSSLLVVTHNERAEIWSVDTVIKTHGPGKFTIDDVDNGVQVIANETDVIAATFSPDGSALAIGSQDGSVKFYQVNMLEKGESPRCLHQWTPHPGKSVSSLYFLDNHQNHRPDIQFWKFAVTGANFNTEIKVWSCESWDCLQTLSIHPNPEDRVVPCLKAEMDLSSKYLFLSDIKRKVLFILSMEQNPTPSNVIISSVAEYRVKLPVLSLTMDKVSFTKLHASAGLKNSDDEGELDNLEEDMGDSEETMYKHIIKLFWIQTKTLQSCRILYKPLETSPPPSLVSAAAFSQESYVLKDGLSDISMDNPALVLPTDIYLSTPDSTLLLTPDDFTTPPSCVPPPQESATESLVVTVEPVQRRKSSQHSGTSSPSREVAEILTSRNDIQHLEKILAASVTPSEGDCVSNNPGPWVAVEIPPWPKSNKRKNDPAELSYSDSSDGTDAASFHNDLNIQVPVKEPNVDSLALKIDSLLQMRQEDRLEMQSLKKEIKVLQEDNKVYMSSLGDNMHSNLDKLITQNVVPHCTKLENLILKTTVEERKISQKELSLLYEKILDGVSVKLENLVKQELTINVVPHISRVLDTFAQKIQLDLNQKIAATESSLRDSITKLLKGKAFTDSLSHSLSVPLQGSVHSACKEVFQASVVPSFDKACNNLFSQLNDSFTKGTAEYIQHLEKHCSKTCVAFDSMLNKVQAEVKSISQSQQTVQAEMTNVQNLGASMIKNNEALLTGIRHTVQEELHRQAVLQSRAATPAPPDEADREMQLIKMQKMVEKGDTNDAFRMALSTKDLHLVVMLCQSVSPEQALNTTRPLGPPILLSLVHQLSADLAFKTDIKVRYIEQAISELNPSDPSIAPHAQGVLQVLLQRLNSFILHHPQHKLAPNLRLVCMAVKSLTQSTAPPTKPH